MGQRSMMDFVWMVVLFVLAFCIDEGVWAFGAGNIPSVRTSISAQYEHPVVLTHSLSFFRLALQYVVYVMPFGLYVQPRSCLHASLRYSSLEYLQPFLPVSSDPSSSGRCCYGSCHQPSLMGVVWGIWS